MPEISRFLGIIINMYFNEHSPPHFHVRYGEYQAEVEIETLQVRAGRLPPRALGLTIEWASMHVAELTSNWNRARAGTELRRIAPLE
jgi:hypothetical protein